MTGAAAVRELYGRLLDAWNGRDAEAFSALFTADGVSVGFDGSQAIGTEIAAHLKPVFADHPTAAYLAKVRQTRELGPDAVLLRATAGMVPPRGTELNPAMNAVQTMVAEQRDGAWRIVLFQNTPAQYHGRPDLTEAHTAELLPVLASGAPLG